MSGKITPELVGWQFIQQYYPRLNREPEKLYQFYNKASSLLHGHEDDTSSEVSHGQAEIRAKVSAENFKGCKVVVCSADSLESADGGVLVQVVGEISWPELQSQKFVQTFFLGKQDTGYFVLNDILRILKDEPVPLSSSQPAIPHSRNGSAEPVSAPEIPEPAPVAQPVQPPVPQVNGETQKSVNGGSEPQPTTPHPAVGQDASMVSPPTSAPDTRAAKGQSQSQKTKTWANAVSQPRQQPQYAQKAKKNPVPSAPAGPVGPAGPAAQSAPQAQARGSKSGDQSQFSAFLRHVVPKVDVAELEAALRSLGKLVNIEIDSSKNRGFAHFADKQSLDRAISKHEVTVNGETVYVETRNQRPRRS